ncbi:MAG: prepilin-type N-terminal cleavage/methylation domain-containing protein [Phycisphaerales bacterium]|nr:MAG: prepilin-type N-terminal cleavage/methylation domain-containing protein [Phycisphaerales bacterium]
MISTSPLPSPGRDTQLKESTRLAGTARRRRDAFSLIEMMIAVVILGLGLIMIATMFPVAWSRGKKLTEYTVQVAVTDAAHATVQMLTRVSSSTSDATSFAGDLMLDPGTTNIRLNSDTRVHALHTENIVVDSIPDMLRPTGLVSGFAPDRNAVDPWNAETAPWRLERLGEEYGLPFVVGLYCSTGSTYCGSLFFPSQIWIEQRVYPPMPEWEIIDREDKDARTAWIDNLDSRRYAWAVFHKLREQTLLGAVDQPREFDMYYVTLRRTQPTFRYTRQDPDPAATPAVGDPGRLAPVLVAALPREQDVLLPSPWRVQVYFPDALASSADPANQPTGIPTVIEVNSKDARVGDFVVDLFPEDTWLIDELNGEIFQVTDRRLNADSTEAYLTLDREVLLEEIDDGFKGAFHFQSTFIDPEEQIRTVWVFPPPVLADRDDDDPVFQGKPPVMAIEKRTLTVAP